jgi:hypothetical protein
MSGPLASWVAEHSQADSVAKFVLVMLALRAGHDGHGADHSVDQLAALTGYGRSTVIQALPRLYKREELERVEAGGGRGRIA